VDDVNVLNVVTVAVVCDELGIGHSQKHVGEAVVKAVVEVEVEIMLEVGVEIMLDVVVEIMLEAVVEIMLEAVVEVSIPHGFEFELVVEIMLELELDTGGCDPSQEEPRMFASIVTPLVLPPVEKIKTSVPLSLGKI